MPESKLEQQNPSFIEATPLNNGDQLDFVNRYASEGRKNVGDVSDDTLQNLSRLASEGARIELDRLEQSPEVLSGTAQLARMSENIVWMREDYGDRHFSLN